MITSPVWNEALLFLEEEEPYCQSEDSAVNLRLYSAKATKEQISLYIKKNLRRGRHGKNGTVIKAVMGVVILAIGFYMFYLGF